MVVVFTLLRGCFGGHRSVFMLSASLFEVTILVHN